MERSELMMAVARQRIELSSDRRLKRPKTISTSKSALRLARSHYISTFNLPESTLYKNLLQAKEWVGLPNDNPYLIPMVIAQYIESAIGFEVLDQAYRMIPLDRYSEFAQCASFASTSDFGMGVIHVTSAPKIARAEIAGLTDESYANAIGGYHEKIEPLGGRFEESADKYLGIVNEAKSYAAALRNDHRGFDLMDVAVKRISYGGEDYSSAQAMGKEAEFFVFGAEIARDLYKLVYPYADRLSPKS